MTLLAKSEEKIQKALKLLEKAGRCDLVACIIAQVSGRPPRKVAGGVAAAVLACQAERSVRQRAASAKEQKRKKQRRQQSRGAQQSSKLCGAENTSKTVGSPGLGRNGIREVKKVKEKKALNTWKLDINVHG
ncbi:hypothetical protein NDU88_002534 [Pleurodeles waltl]|uniref:Uncharacterized protein n=1 Tax=Pleurodeles waltl TaxID=8319 RepID=A0AAV7Q699_PLEWA|nr:hypothetical protein NDU88_002534 [Pleurodeles waltl]